MNSVLNVRLVFFGNRPFLKNQAQGFPQFCLQSAYSVEQPGFKRTIQTISFDDVLRNANIISSHLLYNIRTNNDRSLKIKAHVAPYGNRDSSKVMLRSECFMSPSIGLRLFASLASLKKWRVTKIDVTTSSLRTGSADRDVYVVPSVESANRSKCLRLLLTAAYSLVNSNAKWKVMSDQLLTEIGFYSIPLIPKQFMFYGFFGLTQMLSEIVDDFLICGVPEHVDETIKYFQKSHHSRYNVSWSWITA